MSHTIGTNRVHIGANVYCHGWQHQNRLLRDYLRPALIELDGQGIPVRLWFDRFDARGPHIFLLLSTPTIHQHDVRRLLQSLLDASLAEHPSTERLEPEKLEAYSAACQGKALCTVDRLPGIAPNNSYLIFEQESQGYPFALSRHLADGDEPWEICSGIARATLRELSPDHTANLLAIRRIAEIDFALRSCLDTPGDYWHYHASTLFFAIDRLAERCGEDFPAALSRIVGSENCSSFSRGWREIKTVSRTAQLHRLVEVAVTPPPAGRSRWALLREIVHCLLKQLALPVPLHLPLVLYALHLHARRRTAA